MRIALLSDCYLPRLGGIEVQVHGLARALRDAGHDVEVFTATAGPDGIGGGAVDDSTGVRVHHFSTPLTLGVPVNPLAIGAVRDRLVEGAFDVTHSHMGVVSPFATSTTSVSLAAGLPTAVTWHCVLDRSRPLLRMAGSTRRWASAGAALSAVSRMAAERVGDIADAPISVLPNGIDVAGWRVEPVTPSRFTVVTAVRLASRKRPYALLPIARRLRERLGEGFVIDVFGDGPHRTILERRLDHAGLSGQVRLRGRVTRAELLSAYAGASAYLSTARLEAFGIAPLEARTAGLPVVARRGTGVEDFVRDGVEGLLGADDAGLADALARLATESGLRDRIARHNHGTPPDLDWERVLATTLELYRRAGARRG